MNLYVKRQTSVIALKKTRIWLQKENLKKETECQPIVAENDAKILLKLLSIKRKKKMPSAYYVEKKKQIKLLFSS